MKRSIFLILLLAAISCVSGYLMSKVSLIGRFGMTVFYHEYNLLKIWWQGAAAVFIILMVLFALHSIFYKKLHITTTRLMNIVLLVIALGGLYYCIDDFKTDLSHRLLGHKFHYGVYLFWIQWAMICLFFIFAKKKPTNFPIDPNNNPPAKV